MGIFEEYETFLAKYQKIYGDKTILLYQNGMFFEIYGVDNEKEKVGSVKEISDLLNIQMTRRSKAILENNRSNFLLAGFPLNQIDRYVAMLTEDNGYIVVTVEQVTPSPNPKRAVTNIVGPGTNIRYLSKPSSSYLLSIYIESEGIKVNQIKPVNMLTIGLAGIDVSTGQSIVHQVWNTIDDENRALDEAYRFIQTLQPKEVIVNSRKLNMNQVDLSTHLDLSTRLVHYNLNSVPADYYKISYQNEFLGKAFFQSGMLKPIEYLDLEKSPTALLAYILLLNFCYDQNETIIKEIERPLICNSNNHLILDNNCIHQLNLTSQENLKCSNLFNLIDQTSTSMGRRLLKDRLLMPLLDRDDIINRYNYLDVFSTILADNDTTAKIKHLPGHQKHYLLQLFEPHLNQISDIQRYHRKICLGYLQPSEFPQLHTSYSHIMEVIKIIVSNDSNELLQTLLPKTLQSQLETYMNHYQKIIDLTEIAKYNLNNVTGSFFHAGYNPEIDKIQSSLDDYTSFFSQLASAVSNYISPKSDVVTYEKTNDEYHLAVTNARYNVFVSKCSVPFTIKTKLNNYVINPKDFEVIKNRSGTTCKLVSTTINKVSKQLIETRELLLKKVVEVYSLFLREFYVTYNVFMKSLTKFISEIDFYKSNAKTSLLYNYCRPEIDTPDASDMSYIKCKQVRHPLIERFQDTCKYVPQDLDLNETARGILLFGTNCSGKSSLMKTMGLLVIMAQMGLYVPASYFRFYPYKMILTRIIGNDNLFKGLSSFAVEMGELRGILKRANGRSLVLGDEICHGTETVSAVALVASAIVTLSGLKTNFLFATHLHQLSQMERITDIKTLKIYHLKVKFNELTGDLIYDRRLEEGPGHPIYGLEVARAMDLDKKFIELANDIRKEIMEVTELVPLKKSKYNKEVYMGNCSLPDCQNSAVDTHHIVFQSMADDRGFINHLQKNHKSNLVPLCKKCHQTVHNNQPDQVRYIINGYQMTTDGPKLDYKRIINPSKPDSDIPNIDKCQDFKETPSEELPKVEQPKPELSKTELPKLELSSSRKKILLKK